MRAAAWMSLVAAVVLAGLASLVLDGRYRPNWDGGMYLRLAESVAGGDGYAYQGVAHTKFPPLVPLLVAAALRIGDLAGETAARPEGGLLAVQAVNAAALCGAVLLLGRLALRRRHAVPFVVGVALASLGWPQVAQASAVLAEPAFMVLQAGLLVVAASWGDDERWRREGSAPRRTPVALAALATLAILTRAVGVAVVAAAALHLLGTGGGTRSARLRAVCRGLLPPALVAGAWVAWGAWPRADSLPPGLFETRGYLDWVLTPNDDYTGRLDALGVAARAPGLASRYFSSAVRLVSFETPRLGVPATAVVALGLATAAASLLRRRSDVVAWTVAATAAASLGYTWGGDRFLFPVLPLVAGLALETLATGAEAAAGALRTTSGRLRQGTGTVVAVCVGLAFAPLAARRWSKCLDEARAAAAAGGPRRELKLACEWFRAHAGPEDVIVSDEASSVAWLAGRTSWSYPLVRDDATIRSALRQVGARWLLHVEGREWNGRPRLPRDLAEGRAPGTRVAWSRGPATIVELR